MNTSQEKIHIVIPEGVAKNYIKGIKDVLGGTEKENSLEVTSGPVKLSLRYYSIEGVEFTYVEFNSKKPMIITRTPDNDPEFIHLNIMKEGSFTHTYKESDTKMGDEAGGNIFLYNGLFPVEGEFEANTNVKWIGFKFDRKKMGPIYDGLDRVHSELFDSDGGIAYRMDLSPENDKLISDIFAFDKLPYAKVPLISARALEIFTNVALHFKKEVDEDELSGLHIDDYKLIHTIRLKILNNLETAFTIEELSSEFGVSPTKLKKDFKHLIGSSIYQFYTQERMEEAYRRLKTGDYSVSEVGYDLGYSSLSKFSSMFKKVKGILPTEVTRAK
ncbi:helix-turn-helix domain-containing protein [Carboxylicivirga sp. N1Y90]|uniref:helix-turn-helix domain-containing protein n=1 Tax=Carboxylicivirga fragile TaxID=3417571 RepID=UPI003D3454F3|nr:helix-turn-helix transcriptional regulator [Marinilabiliaceae bacterium N1Y90]